MARFFETPDATQGTQFWTTVVGSVTYDTTAGVKKSGLSSWKCASGAGNAAAYVTKAAIGANSLSAYVCVTDLPAATTSIINFNGIHVRLTSAGVLQLWNGIVAQIGSNGATLSVGTVYRLFVGTTGATTIIATELGVEGTQSISVSGLSIANTSVCALGWLQAPDVSKVLNFQHVYVDDLSYVGETASYGDSIRALYSDGTHIYVGGYPPNTVRKYLLSDLSYVGETTDYGGNIFAFYGDGTHIYVGGGTTNTVRKYLLSDLSYVGETPTYGNAIYAVHNDGTHIYAGGYINNTVRKYLLSDLSYVGVTASYGGSINAIYSDDTHIYVGGGTTKTVRKYLKSDLSYVGETANYGGTIEGLWSDGTHIYVGGSVTNTIRKYLLSDLSYVGETPNCGNSISALWSDGTHIYVGTGTGAVLKYLLSDLSYVGETASFGGSVNALYGAGTHIYAGGTGTFTVRKYLKSNLKPPVDPGDIRVTAKLPAAVNNNQYDTTGGTGAVNERPLSETNYKLYTAKLDYLQDYTLETAAAGDVDLTAAGITLVARSAWMWCKTTDTKSASSLRIVDNGSSTTSFIVNATPVMTNLITNSATYPSNAAGIGQGSTMLATDSYLYECGTLIVYIVAASGPAALSVNVSESAIGMSDTATLYVTPLGPSISVSETGISTTDSATAYVTPIPARTLAVSETAIGISESQNVVLGELELVALTLSMSETVIGMSDSAVAYVTPINARALSVSETSIGVADAASAQVTDAPAGLQLTVVQVMNTIELSWV